MLRTAIWRLIWRSIAVNISCCVLQHRDAVTVAVAFDCVTFLHKISLVIVLLLSTLSMNRCVRLKWSWMNFHIYIYIWYVQRLCDQFTACATQTTQSQHQKKNLLNRLARGLMLMIRRLTTFTHVVQYSLHQCGVLFNRYIVVVCACGLMLANWFFLSVCRRYEYNRAFDKI